MKPQKLRQVVTSVLIFTILVILWGAYVRATGSGAGCGSHWPLCNGQVLPTIPTVKTQIEFFHRITSGLSLILVLSIGYLTFETFPRGSFPRKAATAACLSILLEALIGAGLVLFELVYQDQSLKRTISISLHFSNTLVLIASLVLINTSSGRNGRGWKWAKSPLRTQYLSFCALFFLVGMAGAITALGDTLFPAQNLIQGIHQDLSSSSHFLIKLRAIHPILAMIFAALLSPWVFSHSRSGDPQLLRHGNRLLIGLGSNLFLGILNLVFLAPITLQLLHLLFGVSLWILFLLFIDHLAADDTGA
jgi:heme A synthase